MGVNSKYKNIAKDKIKACNNEVYQVLEFLNKVKYFGEVTLYFQNGNIEFMHQKMRFSKHDIKKTARKIKIQNRNNTNARQTETQLLLPFIYCQP